ncbi:c-type cytochrome [Sandarakinorhabdus sp.]|uniref:c-type cytochrome n=1 Tax=Sandarakinorhabdus sp. TaxID=1916663 RepID=UPI003F725A7D
MLIAALLLAAATPPPAFNYCISCHSVDPAETDLPAPNLDGVIGRRAGSRSDFEYSPAMLAAGASGMVWTRETLQRFLANPQAIVPGTAMQRLPPGAPVDEVVDWLAARAPE